MACILSPVPTSGKAFLSDLTGYGPWYNKAYAWTQLLKRDNTLDYHAGPTHIKGFHQLTGFCPTYTHHLQIGDDSNTAGGTLYIS